MKDKPKVVLSVNHDGVTICVDVFQRCDGTFGFEEYRRDPEDNTGWFAIGHHAHLVFADIKSAKDAAIQHIYWLEGF
ncbi:hypothetical protein N9413_11785 [Paracoccaceae bacterium]|nr:hypothetical protein [Paracoccaceae bacterium]